MSAIELFDDSEGKVREILQEVERGYLTHLSLPTMTASRPELANHIA